MTCLGRGYYVKSLCRVLPIEFLVHNSQIITHLLLLNMETLMVKILGAGVCGVASHWLYFVRGEHHLHAPILFYGYIVLALSVYLYEASRVGHHDGGSSPTSLVSATAIVSSYAASLFTSVIIYRLFFHRLRNFPGPLPLRVSKL